SEIKRPEIREITKGNYRIIYKIKEDEMLILAVKNCRQLLRPDELQP
ncbi:MAG: plasmid stabilization protein, partial [Gammaproteobacteria bacterium]